MRKINPTQIYEVRRLQLKERRKQLEAGLANVDLGERLLDIERAYDLLGTEATLDISTGEIKEAQGEESGAEGA